jgi:hypothetical protein
VNEAPPNPGQDDEVDDLYRRASALDSSRPSESVRRAVLDHAAQLAAQRRPETGPVKIDFTRPAANQAWRRPAIFGTLAAAALAGFLVAPQFLTSRGPVTPESPPVVVSKPQSAMAPQAPALALAQNEDQLQDRMFKRSAAPPPSAEAKKNLEPLAGRQPGASSAESAATQGSAATRGSATAQTSAAAPSPFPAASLAGARSGANEQSADKAQGADNVQSSPGPQDAITVTAQRRMQGVTGGISALSAPPHAAAPMAPLRLADPAVELRLAAEIGDLAALQVLIDKQPEIDARDASGRTALMIATVHGQAPAVDVLLAHGADPNASDARGTTPLQAAIAGDQSAIVAALRRAGAR